MNFTLETYRVVRGAMGKRRCDFHKTRNDYLPIFGFVTFDCSLTGH